MIRIVSARFMLHSEQFCLCPFSKIAVWSHGTSEDNIELWFLQ
jgi:hypothetical protein